MKKQIITLILAVCPFLAYGHSCPYDWNIEFSKQTLIRGTNFSHFVKQFNTAVQLESKGTITNAIIYSQKPIAVRIVPKDSPYKKQMQELIQRHEEITAPLVLQGAKGYSFAPVEVNFPSNCPIACILAVSIRRHRETKDGIIIDSQPDSECRAYRLTDKIKDIIDRKQQKHGEVNQSKFASAVLAQESEKYWDWILWIPDESGESFVAKHINEAMTYYLPKENVMIVIESPRGHKKIQNILTQKKYLYTTKQVDHTP